MLSPGFNSNDEPDNLLDDAVKVVIQYDNASPSLLQRRLSIGYARAARIMDQLQNAGVVSMPEGSRPRTVLISSYEEFLKTNKKKDRQTGETEKYSSIPKNYKTPEDIKLSLSPQSSWGMSLSEAIGSKDFKNFISRYPVLLGHDNEGKLRIVNLTDMNSLIIVGNPLSTKEVWVDTILATLLIKCSPTEIRLVLIDGNHHLDFYDGIPHLLTPVITDFNKRASAFRWTVYEMERRLKLFSSKGVRNMDDYNKLSKDDALPKILLICFCDWTDVETTDAMIQITNMASKTGIHLVVVTNRLSDKNLSPDIKANIPSRSVFTVTNAHDSRLAGVNRAEHLRDGEMLYKWDNDDPIKLMTIYTSDKNVKEVVEAVKCSAR